MMGAGEEGECGLVLQGGEAGQGAEEGQWTGGCRGGWLVKRQGAGEGREQGKQWEGCCRCVGGWEMLGGGGWVQL